MTNSKRDISRISILWATVEHAIDLSQKHGELFDTSWSKESFEGLLSHPGSTAFVARSGNPQETIGFVVGQLAADEAEILTLGVVKDWQRSGLGLKLVQSLARAAQRAEAKRLFLEVAADNATAIALYKKAGFIETGRRANYYERKSGPPVDALTMALSLT